MKGGVKLIKNPQKSLVLRSKITKNTTKKREIHSLYIRNIGIHILYNYIRNIKNMKDIRTHAPPSHSRRLPVSPNPSHSFRTKFPPRHHFLVLTIENARGARGAPLRMCQGENVWDLVLFPLLC